MKAIEMETIIPLDGRLPSLFQEVFGRKVRAIFLFEEESSDRAVDQSFPLMELAGKIQAFKSIKDPVAWQRDQRNEWTRE